MKILIAVDGSECSDAAVLEVAGKFVPWPMVALPAGTREGAIVEISVRAAVK